MKHQYWRAPQSLFALRRSLVLAFRIYSILFWAIATVVARMKARQCATIQFMTPSALPHPLAITSLSLFLLLLGACAATPDVDRATPVKIAADAAPAVSKAPAAVTGAANAPPLVMSRPAPPLAAPESTRDRTSEITVYALSLVGVRYKFGGNNAATGFDCSGFVNHVFGEIADYALPRNSEAIAQRGIVVAKNDLQAGDLVFYNTRSRANSHVGIYLGNNSFVHAPSRGKSVEIVDMTESYWQKRFNGARRLLSVLPDQQVVGALITSPTTPSNAAQKTQPAKSIINRVAGATKPPGEMPITNGQ